MPIRPCSRSFADGQSTIALEWKRMFCRTSAQIICHYIGTITRPRGSPDVNPLSGLFQNSVCIVARSCNLGRRCIPWYRRIPPLSRWVEDETMFGILACLVCLLVSGDNPLNKAHISVQALLCIDRAGTYSYGELNPAELTKQVSVHVVSIWTQQVYQIISALCLWYKD
jgi:hypothetical protein